MSLFGRRSIATLSSVTPFSPLFFGGRPNRNGLPQKGFPFFSRVTQQLSTGNLYVWFSFFQKTSIASERKVRDLTEGFGERQGGLAIEVHHGGFALVFFVTTFVGSQARSPLGRYLGFERLRR